MSIQTDDGWGVADSYDISEFYTKGTDGRGHGENVRVKLPPDVAGEIAAIVSSGLLPDYGTPQALIRDAIVHRLHWLSENADNPILRDRLTDVVRKVTIEETTSRYIALVDSFEDFLQRTKDVCERAARMGDNVGLAAHLVDLNEYATNIREPYSTVLRQVAEHYEAKLDLSHKEPDTPLDGGVGPTNEENT